MLTPGGALAIRTPNLASAWARVSLALRHLGVPPSAVTPPEHLTQLTPQALDALVATAVFSRVDRWYEPPPGLRYELAMTRLPRRLRQTRSPLLALRLAWALLLYPPAYTLERLTSGLRHQDYSLVALYRRG